MRRSLIAVAALVASLTLAACGSSSSQPLPSGMQGQSAAVILLNSRTAGVKAGFALIHASTVPTQISSAVIQAGSVDGTETSTGSSGTLEVRLVDNQVFFKGDALYMRNNFKKAKPQYTNQWISIPESSPYFASGTNLTIAGNFVNTMPVANLKIVGVRTYNGVKCVEITGQHSTNSGGLIRVYLSYASPYLPVAVVTSVSLLGHGAGQIQKYSQWGVPFVVSVPPNAIPIGQTGLK